jgi:IS30 family transposase
MLLPLLKVLGQKGSSDRWLPSNTSKNPTPSINHPSTTMPSQKTGYLTDFEKGQIVALREKNIAFSEIGQLLHRSQSTVKSFYNRYQKRGDGKNLPFTGRPKIIDTRTCRRLARESKKGRHQPLSELRNNVAPHASVKTVKRALASVNIKK